MEKHWFQEKLNNDHQSVVYCAEMDEEKVVCTSVCQYVKRAGSWSKNIIAPIEENDAAKEEFKSFITKDGSHDISWLIQEVTDQAIIAEIMQDNLN